MSNQASDARLVELESLVAQQQKTIEELHEVVVRQSGEIERLTQAVEVLGLKVQRIAEGQSPSHIRAER